MHEKMNTLTMYMAAVAYYSEEPIYLTFDEKLMLHMVRGITNFEQDTINQLVALMPQPILRESHVRNIREIIYGVYSDNKDNWGRLAAVIGFIAVYVKCHMLRNENLAKDIMRDSIGFLAEYRREWLNEQGNLGSALAKRFPWHAVIVYVKGIFGK